MIISKPELPNELKLQTFDDLTNDQTVEDSLFSKLDVNQVDAIDTKIFNSKISGCTILDSNFQGSRWRDVVVESTNLSTTKNSDCIISRVKFDSCRLQGIDFNVSELSDVVFINCNLDLSNFRRAKLRRIKFENCSLVDADFMSCGLRDIIFDGFDLEQANFDESIKKDVDMSNSQIINIKNIGSLKGVTIDSMQLISLAPELARILGIKVK